MSKLVVAMLLAGLASCSSGGGDRSNGPASGCDPLPAGFFRVDDEGFWSQQPAGIAAPMVWGIRIERSGRILWGEAIELGRLENLLKVTASLQPIPYMTIDFPAGTPCASVRQVRAVMERQLGCSKRQVCLQGDYQAYVKRLDAEYEASHGVN